MNVYHIVYEGREDAIEADDEYQAVDIFRSLYNVSVTVPKSEFDVTLLYKSVE